MTVQAKESDRCEARNLFFEEHCPQRAVAMVVVACKHEHLKERRSCSLHVDSARANEMDCADCREPITLLRATPLGVAS